MKKCIAAATLVVIATPTLAQERDSLITHMRDVACMKTAKVIGQIAKERDQGVPMIEQFRRIDSGVGTQQSKVDLKKRIARVYGVPAMKADTAMATTYADCMDRSK